MNLEIENFEEGSQKNEKEETLNKVVSEFVTKYKNHIYGNDDNFEELLQDLKTTTQEVRNLELETELLEKFEEYMAKALLLVFRVQVKNEKPIDFDVIEDITMPKALAVEIQKQFVQFAEKIEEIDKSLAYDVLKRGIQVSEDNLQDDTIWEAFRLFEIIDQKVNNQEKQLLAEVVPQRTSFLRRILLGKGTSQYVIGKFDEEKQEWVPIREEYHAYPPKRKMEDCIGIEINDVRDVDMRYIERLPNLQELTLGKKVWSVRGLFRSNLRKIVFSDDVQVISDNVFMNCEELEEIKCGQNLKKIGRWAFRKCEKLKKVQLGKSIRKILRGAFEECSSLEEIDLPDSLETLEREVFKNCRHLEKVKFGTNLIRIGSDCFKRTALREIGEMPFLEDVEVGAFSIFNDIDSPLHVPASVLEVAKGNKIFLSGSYIDVDGVLTMVDKNGKLRKLKKTDNPGETVERQKGKEMDEEYIYRD